MATENASEGPARPPGRTVDPPDVTLCGTSAAVASQAAAVFYPVHACAEAAGGPLPEAQQQVVQPVPLTRLRRPVLLLRTSVPARFGFPDRLLVIRLLLRFVSQSLLDPLQQRLQR